MSAPYVRHELLRHQAVRENTFYNWNNSFLDYKILAAAGFYYENQKDYIFCFSCDLMVSKLEDVLEIFKRHKASPNCQFLKGNDISINRTTNNPGIVGLSFANKHSKIENEPLFYDLFNPTTIQNRGCYSCRSKSPIYAPIEIPAVSFGSRILNIDDFFSFMRYEKNRLETFKIGLYKETAPCAEYLASQGFFYTLLNDCIQCAFCKIVFCGLQKANIDCMHLIYSFNCEFVNKKSNNVSITSIPDSIEDNNSNNRLMCKVCLENEICILLDCKHLVLCQKCANYPSLKTCPVCRKIIESKCKVFLS